MGFINEADEIILMCSLRHHLRSRIFAPHFHATLNVHLNAPPLRGHEATVVVLSHYQQTDLIN